MKTRKIMTMMALATAVCCAGMTGCGESNEVGNLSEISSAVQETETTEATEATTELLDELVYESEYVRITFYGAEWNPDKGLYAFNMEFKIENLTDDTIKCWPADVFMNGMDMVCTDDYLVSANSAKVCHFYIASSRIEDARISEITELSVSFSVNESGFGVSQLEITPEIDLTPYTSGMVLS